MRSRWRRPPSRRCTGTSHRARRGAPQRPVRGAGLRGGRVPQPRSPPHPERPQRVGHRRQLLRRPRGLRHPLPGRQPVPDQGHRRPGPLSQALFDLANANSSRLSQARGLLTVIFGISEAARFRTLADRVAPSFDSGDPVTYSSQRISLFRNWANVSHVYAGHVNCTDEGASTSVAGASISDARQAAALLAIALNDGANPNLKDEL
ncbi:ribosome-inactivating family protein [Streptomyces sp. NPDC058420]|uniref:ribosome-inactivating family protein n=1 Tax=Streptomyces sp. NPDC058420 TaxID=3346489 RepID=UPI00366A4B2B